MKKYKVNDEFSILADLPNSFEISCNQASYRLTEYNNDKTSEIARIPITVNQETLLLNHVLLHTDNTYMRIIWYKGDENTNANGNSNPDANGNGQIEIGKRGPEEGSEFLEWNTLVNGIPQEVITMAYFICKSPESVEQFVVPLFDNNSNNNSNNAFMRSLQNLPVPSTEPEVEAEPEVVLAKNNNNTKKKKRKYKVRGATSLRRLRNY